MKSVSIFFVLFLISSVFSSPSEHTGNGIIIRHKRQADSLENTRRLIQELAENMRNASQQALTSINGFSRGVQERMAMFQEEFMKGIAAQRARVANAIQDFRNKVQNAGAAVLACVEHQRSAADKLFNETVAKTIGCATDRIDDIGGNIISLANSTSVAIQNADTALNDSRNCTVAHANDILAAGGCLGEVALRVQYQAATYAIQSGLTITRIGFAIATLQTTLEACASMRLLEASLGVAKITLDIGACSASSIFSIFTSSNSSST